MMRLIDHLGSKLTSLEARIGDRLWERRLGIRTSGPLDVGIEDAEIYTSVSYQANIAVLRHLSLEPDDVFVDVGCGKGRLACLAATWPIAKVIGIEISPALSEIARANARRLRIRRAPILIENCSAVDFDYRDATALMLFNPFGSKTMGAFVHRIGEALLERPRPLRIAYLNPVHESVLASTPWLERYDRLPVSQWRGRKYAVTFWRTCDHQGVK